jgi:diguanylate cyclase (GGDEF)-like protein/PAS domain S-box-containing protein
MKDDNSTKSQLIKGRTGKLSAEGGTSQLTRLFYNPVNLVVIILFSILMGEIIVALGFSFLMPLSIYEGAVLDAVCLTIIIFPILYFFVVRPLQEHITKREIAEEKYRSLIAFTDDSIYLVDRDYKYVFMNEKHLSRLGLSGNEYIGRSYREFHSAEKMGWFVKEANEVFNKGTSVRHEYKSPKDGKYYLLTLSPVKKSDGTVTALTVVSKDITELKVMEENLRMLSLTDELTGLYNRRGFLTFVEQLLKLSKRQKTGIFLLYADVDNLKSINDTWGHQEGDLALKEIADIFRENYRESDVIARIGGDEFVVIPVGTTGDSIEIITTRLQKALEIRNAKRKRGYNVSLSSGISYYDPENPCSIDELLAQADKLMYEQKSNRQDF